MADSINSYSNSDKIRQIQSKISTTNTLTSFLDTKNLSSFITTKNSESQNILKMMSDILVSLAGSQEKMKKMLVDLMANNLPTIEKKMKKNIKDYSLKLLSCGVDSKLYVPLGVVDQSVSTIPEQYPYIDQYDFYGLFVKDINDPLQKIQFDKNLNTFIKNKIDSKTSTFTWANSDNVNIIQFTYDEPQERIKIGPPTGVDWGPNGIGVKQFVDLYIDSINLFPTESILKDLLDSIFNMKASTPAEIPFNTDFKFLDSLIQKKCNCKHGDGEDDRSKSTFDIGYEDFIPEKTVYENDLTLTTDIKFGPVDAPIPLSINPPQPKLDESYLNTVSMLSKDEFIKGNRNNRETSISTVIDKVGQNKSQQDSNGMDIPINGKFSFKPNMETDMNLKMILMLPVILVAPLFSPKLSMYFSVIYKRYYVSEPNKDLWKDKDEYYLFMSKLIELIVKDLIEYLLKKLFTIIKKEVINLVKKIAVKILSEKVMGYVDQLKSLIDMFNMLKGKIPPQLPMINFSSCKSVLDNLLNLFDTANIPPGPILPPGMSMLGMTKAGMSPTSMTQKAVEKMNSMGLNTKALPDGTPNPNVLIANAMSEAVVSEIRNSRIQISTIGAVGPAEGGGTIT